MKYIQNKFKNTDRFNLIAAIITIVFFAPILIMLLNDLLTNGSNLL